MRRWRIQGTVLTSGIAPQYSFTYSTCKAALEIEISTLNIALRFSKDSAPDKYTG